ncbi:hypothetical protein MTO96_027750 [Rhipicephalus appendiculatus]
MDNLPRERDQLSSSAFAERGGDIGASVDCAEMDRCRLPCTAYSDQVCQINNILPLCNELLIDSGLKLWQRRGGSLTLASISRDRMTRAGPDSYRATPFLRWLLKTHICITTLQLSDDTVRSHSKIVLQELPDNSRIKNLTLDLFDDDNTDTHLRRHLPRLRNVEVLSCSAGRACRDAVAAVSALLRTTKRLACLVFSGSFEFGQPPKTLIDALATNSTLKSFHLETYWETAEPPGPLGEYMRNNGLLTSLTVSGLDVDRETLLLEEALVCNDTLSTLEVLNVCGGERSASFITRILAKCSTLRKLYVGWARTPYTKISEAKLVHCAEALVQNQTLEDLTLPYCLWHSNNWITFFALLPRNKHLKKLDVTTYQYAQDYPTFPPVLEALALTKPSAHVSFGHYIHGWGVNLLRYSVFSSIDLGGEESGQVDALQRLPALDNFTSLTVDVSEAGERLFSALAKCIRETTVLRELKLHVTNRLAPPDNTASYTCWTLLFESMSANTSISDLDIFTNGKFRLQRPPHPHHRTQQRNCDILERAAAFIQTAPLDWHTATAFEKVARCPALIRELAKEEGIATAEVARMLRSHLRSVEGLHDFMRLTGVVKEKVKCAPPVEGCGMQLPDLGEDCWRLVRRYLSFDDVKRFTIAKPSHFTSSGT